MEIKVGQRIKAKHGAKFEGTITRISQSVGRPYGTITTLYDLKLDNGTEAQLPTSMLRSNYKILG